MQVQPKYQEYVERFIPQEKQGGLELKIDHDNQFNRDLIAIAENIIDWEVKLVAPLELTPANIRDIKDAIVDPKLRRRRVLEVWKEREGYRATYGLLLKKCLEAVDTATAEEICKLVANFATTQSGNQQSLQPLSPDESSQPLSPDKPPQPLSPDKSAQPLSPDKSPQPLSSVELTPDILGDLKQQLGANFRDICSKYANFGLNVIEILEEKNINIRKLRAFVKMYLQIDSYFPELKQELTNAKTVDEICDFVTSNFASFLNCEVFGEMLKKFGGDAGTEEWKDYSKHLTNYVNKHKIDEFIKINPGLLVHTTDSMEKLVLKVDIDRFGPLMKVCEIQIQFADILKISHSNLLLLDIKKGCVLLTFLIPVSVAKTTFAADKTFSVEQVKALQKLSIKWLLSGNHYMLIEDEDEDTRDEQTSPVTNETNMEEPHHKKWLTLVEASLNGEVEVAELLLENGAQVDQKDENGVSALMFACLNGHTEIARLLLEKDSQPNVVNYTDFEGNTPLHYACMNGRLDTVRVLISEFKADVSICNSYNDTPLHIAAVYGKEKVALALIKEFGYNDISARGVFGRSVLHYACAGGNVSLVRTLILVHPAVVMARDDENDTPLHIAALEGKEEVALALIKEFGCSISMRGELGRSVLHSACNGGNINLIRTLILDHQADVMARDDENNTPLHIAALTGKEEVVRVLIKEFGCNICMRGKFGQTVLHTACKKGYVSLVRTLILNHQADVMARDDGNSTPLHNAAFNGKEEVALALIKEFGCNISMRGEFGRSVLHYACEGGNVGLVRTLILDHQADVMARDDDNNTPLHIAALTGKEEVALDLIKEFGCNISVRGKLGRSVLHYACEGGNVSLVHTLIIDHQADVMARDDNNDTPLHIAALSGNEEVALALINEFGCKASLNGQLGLSVFHCACAGGNVSLVQTLMLCHLENTQIYLQSNSGISALMLASYSGHFEVAKFLLDNGALVDLKANDGTSALMFAQDAGHTELVELLKEYGAEENTSSPQQTTDDEATDSTTTTSIIVEKIKDEDETEDQNEDKEIFSTPRGPYLPKKKFSAREEMMSLFKKLSRTSGLIMQRSKLRIY